MKCQYIDCEDEARAWIRTFDVCQKHFRQFRMDNIMRIGLGMDLPAKLIKLQEEKKC